MMSAQPRAANLDGALLEAARQRKNRTYPELVGPRGRARLVVLAGDVGADGLRKLVRSRLNWPRPSRDKPPILRRRAEQAWRMRWQAILSCVAAKAFADSLFELQGGLGADGVTLPTRELENTFRFAGLG